MVSKAAVKAKAPKVAPAGDTEVITWISCVEQLPDSERTVLIELARPMPITGGAKGATASTWLGFLALDGIAAGEWCLSDGMNAPAVRRWAELPKGIGR